MIRELNLILYCSSWLSVNKRIFLFPGMGWTGAMHKDEKRIKKQPFNHSGEEHEERIAPCHNYIAYQHQHLRGWKPGASRCFSFVSLSFPVFLSLSFSLSFCVLDSPLLLVIGLFGYVGDHPIEIEPLIFA